MEKPLLSKKELAERWGVSSATVDRRVREGLITPALTKPIRFNIEDVLRVEGTEVGRLSPFERKRLEKEIKELKKENEKLKEEREEIRRQATNFMSDVLMPILKEV